MTSSFCWALTLIPALPLLLRAQTTDSAEVVSHETLPTFKLEVQRNLVVVRAVVRDANGHALGHLRKEDFRIFDNGKAQTIAQFGVESGSSARRAVPGATEAQKRADTEALSETAAAPSNPERYLGLYFDDVHMKFDEVVRTRDAAAHYLTDALEPGDRVGIFTSSGQTVLDFTDDRAKLRESLLNLRQRPVVPSEPNPCPDVSDYQAYQIIHARDPYAVQIAVEETLTCRYGGDDRYRGAAEMDAETEAMRALNFSETESEQALRALEQLIRRMAILPGRRQVVLLSPGFLTSGQEQRIGQISDRALRAALVIDTLDARGLYTVLPPGEADRRPIVLPDRIDLMGRKDLIQLARASKISDYLRDLAYDTGGEFFHNSNDLDGGFRKLAEPPQVYYVLAFSPQNLKLDGRFHSIKVSVAGSGLTIQVRRGYYAPQAQVDPAEQAKEEIREALFSQDEVKELPVEVHTQFFRVNDGDARLAILTHVDIHLLRFRKGDGRNLNSLTFVTALFDRDGKYMIGKEKRVEFRLRDNSLERLLASGITAKTTFDVKPGTYLVRQVVRDVEGGQLSGLNRTVEIPF